jgi:hypothetical protein
MRTFLQMASIFLFILTCVSAVKINEFTVDPQTDWDNSSTIGASDEWVEFYNEGTSSVNLTNWKLFLIDGTPANQTLNGIISAGGYFVVLNPTGDLTMSGQIILYDFSGGLVDSVAYGSWDDGNVDDNAPDGNAANISDECLARIPNGVDSEIDIDDFKKTSCTYGVKNSETNQSNQTSENQQEMNVTIGDVIALRIYPATLNFGVTIPGTNNNPALNGPITFDANGSNTDVIVEVDAVNGFPFEQGLRIDGKNPLDASWQIECVESGLYCNYDLQTATPTLNIPPGSIAGTNRGIITYLITGSPP